MRRPRRILAAFAARVLAGAVGVGAPTAMAADVSADGATSPDNIAKALDYLDQINKDVHGTKRTPLSEQQIADAKTLSKLRNEYVKKLVIRLIT